MAQTSKKYQEGVALIKQRVLHSPATTTPKERQEAFAGRSSNAPLDAYLKRVQEAAYQVTDEEVAALLLESSEDALFELTISAALGTASQRLEIGLGLIEILED